MRFRKSKIGLSLAVAFLLTVPRQDGSSVAVLLCSCMSGFFCDVCFCHCLFLIFSSAFVASAMLC